MDPSTGGNVNPHFQPGMIPGPGQQQPQQGMHQPHPQTMYQQVPQGQDSAHQMNPMMQGNLMGGSHMAQPGQGGSGNAMIPTTIPGQPQQHPPQQLPPNLIPFANLSTSQLTKLGMEQIQEIVTKTGDLFNILRSTQPPVMMVPNGHPQSIGNQEERKVKIAEIMNRIGFIFKRLRKIYEKVSEETTQMEFVQIEHLIPLKKAQINGSINGDSDSGKEKMDTNTVKKLSVEKATAIELLKLKNRQIKEMIDLLREFVWDINVMLAMRKP